MRGSKIWPDNLRDTVYPKTVPGDGTPTATNQVNDEGGGSKKNKTGVCLRLGLVIRDELYVAFKRTSMVGESSSAWAATGSSTAREEEEEKFRRIDHSYSSPLLSN